jgi:amino acid adenylation domain-containing protein/non-ribosomal peptide synthase protein (TIGR01720 family)
LHRLADILLVQGKIREKKEVSRHMVEKNIGLEATPEHVLFNLTHAQKRIWNDENRCPGSHANSLCGLTLIRSKIDTVRMNDAINDFIRENEGIRLKIDERNGTACQYVSRYERQEFAVHDFSGRQDPESAMNGWISECLEKPLMICNEKLFRFHIIILRPDYAGYLGIFHHIICDGWSISLVSEQIWYNYFNRVRNHPREFSPRVSYTEYVGSEAEYLKSKRFGIDREFWKSRFCDINLPDKVMRRENPDGKRRSYVFEESASSSIRELCRSQKWTFNSFFNALMIICLSRNKRSDEMIIGVPVSNRTGKEKQIFGMFTSTMPLIIKLDDDMTVKGLTDRIRRELKYGFIHQKYPYDVLIGDLSGCGRSAGVIFDASFNYYNTGHKTELSGFKIDNREIYNGQQFYSMQWVVKDWLDDGRFQLDIDYKVEDYYDIQIESMLHYAVQAVAVILADKDTKIADLPVISDYERSILTAFNDTSAAYREEKTVVHLFEDQVMKTPDKIAVEAGGLSLTYRELNNRINRLAALLREKGVKSDVAVGLYCSHSIEAVVSIMGILKAGGAYVPMDPDAPYSRLEHMVSDSGILIIVSDLDKIDAMKFECEIMHVAEKNFTGGEYPDADLIVKPNGLAYIIYTSGSTGLPKGVMIEHHGLTNYIEWARKVYLGDKDEVFPLYSSLSFDLTVTSIFTPLLSGNKIIVYGDDKDEFVLYRIMRENKSTVIKLTPSHLSLLKNLDNRNSNVKKFIVGGEDLKVGLANGITDSFGGNIEIYNEYGPTETVVGCMIHRFIPGIDTGISVPIGIPADNVKIHLLNDDLKPVPLGDIGEIFVSGPGVARGYKGRPELTKMSFLDNPFGGNGKIYRTGDLARFIDDVTVVYVGRKDHQVKIRGFRIEPGEIEKKLLEFGFIREAVVLDIDRDGHKFLCAYLVAEREFSQVEVEKKLSVFLPEYMIPRHYIVVEGIPLTANGKVDRTKLPVPAENDDDRMIICPRNEKEKALSMAVADVLKCKEVSMYDNFFHLGGDSITAIQLINKLREYDHIIKLKDVLSNPILEDMAKAVELVDGRDSAEQSPAQGHIEPTPVVSWFFSRKFPEENSYIQSMTLRMKERITEEDLEKIMPVLLEHHDSLRINYDRNDGKLFYNNAHLEGIGFCKHDSKGLNRDRLLQEMSAAKELILSRFDIEKDLLFKACLFDCGESESMIMFFAHHLIIDGISWRIILEDFERIYRQLKNGEIPSLALKTLSWKEWSTKLAAYCGESRVRGQTAFWKNILEAGFVFPHDSDEGPDTYGTSHTVVKELDRSKTADFLTIANNPYGTVPRELLLTALAVSMSQFANAGKVVFEVESHGRDGIDIDISRTVGWFTAIYPVCIMIDGNELAGQIISVKEQLRKIPDNGFGFGVLKYVGGEINELERKTVRLNFLGDIGSQFENGMFGLIDDFVSLETGAANHMTALIDMNCFVVNGILRVFFTYSCNRFKSGTVDIFSSLFVEKLEEIIIHCISKKNREYSPSDFNMIDLSNEELSKILK